MLKFKKFLSEQQDVLFENADEQVKYKKLDASKYHFDKYVHPTKREDKDQQLYLVKDHKGFPKGTPVYPHKDTTQYEKYPIKKNGQPAAEKKSHTSVEVEHPATGKRHKIEVEQTALGVESSNNPKFGHANDENSFIKLANYAAKHSLRTPRDLAKHIAAAKQDSNHPLSFESARADEFHGQSKAEEHSEHSHYNELHQAMHGVAALASHPKVAKHWGANISFEPAGTNSYETHSHMYMKHLKNHLSDQQMARMKDDAKDTSKADVLKMTVNRGAKQPKLTAKISLKKGPAQAESASAIGTTHILGAAAVAAGYKYTGNLDTSHPIHKDIVNLGIKIAKSKGVPEHLKAIQKHIDNIHAKYDQDGVLSHHILHHSLTGEGKFKNPDGKADLIVASPKFTEPSSKTPKTKLSANENKKLADKGPLGFAGSAEETIMHVKHQYSSQKTKNKTQHNYPRLIASKNKSGNKEKPPTARLFLPGTKVTLPKGHTGIPD